MFYERPYELYAILGSPHALQPWLKPTWVKIAAVLEPLIRLSRGNPSIRTQQLRTGSGSPNQRATKFGRIGWNDAGIEKWTHKEDGRLVSGEYAFFVSAEGWVPSWSICEREHQAPDIYLGISNQAALGKTPMFNPVFISSVASDLGEAAITEARESADAVAGILSAVLRAHCVRPWGTGTGVGFSDGIQDMPYVGLFQPGARQSRVPIPSMLKGNWEAF